MVEPSLLYSKEGFLFKKNNVNNYSLSFQIENKSINLPKIVDFNLVKLIYDLNKDVYENVNLKIINENEAILNVLMKPLFKDLGIQQRFTYLHMKKQTMPESISFISQTINSIPPENMPANATLMPIKIMTCTCNIITPHNIEFVCNVQFENTLIVPNVVEKMIGLILFKIFKRVKLFIENVTI